MTIAHYMTEGMSDSDILCSSRPINPVVVLKNSFESVLRSLSSVLFECTLVLNESLIIYEDSPQLRTWLSVPNGVPLIGRSFDEFIFADRDRLRFREFVHRQMLHGVSLPGPAGMIELSLRSVNPYVCDPVVFHSKLYVAKMINDESVKLFVGIQNLVSAQETLPREDPAAVLCAPSLIRKELRTPSLADTIESRHPLSVEDYGPGVQYGENPIAPPHVSLVSVFYRALNRDIFQMVDRARLSSGKRMPASIALSFEISDRESVREDVLRLLSNSAQFDFIRAEARRDIRTIANLLENSTVGNVNFISFVEGKLPTTSVQYLCGACRYFLSSLSWVPESEFFTYYNDWMAGYESLNIFCSSMRATMMLTMVSIALTRPSIFESPSEINRLDAMFRQLIGNTDTFGVTDPVRLLAVYSVCLLWSRVLQRQPGRREEAVRVLEATARDMEIFCLRHPGSNVIHQIKAIVSFDLASLALTSEKPDIERAELWMFEINKILVHSQNMNVNTSVIERLEEWLAALEKLHPKGNSVEYVKAGQDSLCSPMSFMSNPL